MNLIEAISSAIKNVLANKMRSFLTMLGIIIGISSVIAIVAIGQGGKLYMTSQFENIGTNIIHIKVSAKNNDIQNRDYLTLEDADIVKEKVPKVSEVVPYVEGFGSMKSERAKKEAAIAGLTPGYLKVFKTEMISGRFLNEHDIETSKSVAVIDDLAAKALFKTTDVVGRQFKLNVRDNNLTITIVGVMKNPAGNLASTFGNNFPGYVYMPITKAMEFMPDSKIQEMSVVLTDMNNSKEISDKIVRVLEVRHRNSGKYAAQEGFKEVDTINNVLNTFTAIIGAIAGISLLVGGIGVMNIMLVSVTERTREIGIRMAIGAKRRDIRLQFLIESLVLCLMGGFLGIVLGVSLAMIAGKVLNLTIPVSFGTVMVAFLFSSAVGIFFGLYPANKAAKLDPIEALRYE